MNTHLSRDVSILVHSINPTHAPQVTQRQKRGGFDVSRVPFETLDRKYFQQWLEDAYYD